MEPRDRDDVLLAFGLGVLFAVAAMTCAGCATVTTRNQTITDDETTTLTTRTLVLGTAKIKEAQPDAVYQFEGGEMRTGSTSTGLESDISKLVDALVQAVTALATANAALGALGSLEDLAPLVDLLPGLLGQPNP